MEWYEEIICRDGLDCPDCDGHCGALRPRYECDPAAAFALAEAEAEENNISLGAQLRAALERSNKE